MCLDLPFPIKDVDERENREANEVTFKIKITFLPEIQQLVKP